MKITGIKVRGRSMLKYYLFTYCVVLFIPLFILCVYYMCVITAIGEDDVQLRKNELKHASRLIDTTLTNLSYLGDSLVGNLAVNTFTSTTDALSYPNVWKIKELQQSLPNLYQVDPSVFDYFIFFDKSKLVLNKQIVYKYDDFYNLYLRKKCIGSYEEWLSDIGRQNLTYGLHSMETYIYKQTSEKNMLIYTRPLITYSDVSNHSAVYIMIEDQVLDSQMPTLPPNSMQYITDLGDNVIYCRQNGDTFLMEETMAAVNQALLEDDKVQEAKLRLYGEDFVILRHVSAQSGFTYYMVCPKTIINQRMVSTMLSLTVCVLLAAAVGMFLSCFMSIRNATPINNILKEVSRTSEQFGDYQSVFSSLKTTFHYLVNTNSNLAETLEDQKRYIRNAFINRLLYKNYGSDEEYSKIAGYIGLEYKDRSFCVVIFHFCMGSMDPAGLELINSCVISLLEVIECVLPGSLCCNTGDGQVVLLMNLPLADQACYRKVTEKALLRVKEEMPANIMEKIFAYGGNVVSRLSDIYTSYNNASYMFWNEREQIENTVIWYTENTGNIPAYPPADISAKLSHYVAAGDGKSLHDELESIMKTYIIDNDLPVYLQHMLLNELQIVMFRILSQIDIEEAEYRKYYDQLEENYNASLTAQITTTLNLYRDVCQYMHDRKQETDFSALIPAIVSYIDSGYGDSCLSLTSVADTFHISEPYLSSTFKQIVGIKFSSYVERVRIDKAKDFLKTTSMPVGEIAERVGYYSANSFCRAFKRVTGISALEYRRKDSENQ